MSTPMSWRDLARPSSPALAALSRRAPCASCGTGSSFYPLTCRRSLSRGIIAGVFGKHDRRARLGLAPSAGLLANAHSGSPRTLTGVHLWWRAGIGGPCLPACPCEARVLAQPACRVPFGCAQERCAASRVGVRPSGCPRCSCPRPCPQRSVRATRSSARRRRRGARMHDEQRLCGVPTTGCAQTAQCSWADDHPPFSDNGVSVCLPACLPVLAQPVRPSGCAGAASAPFTVCSRSQPAVCPLGAPRRDAQHLVWVCALCAAPVPLYGVEGYQGVRSHAKRASGSVTAPADASRTELTATACTPPACIPTHSPHAKRASRPRVPHERDASAHSRPSPQPHLSQPRA